MDVTEWLYASVYPCHHNTFFQHRIHWWLFICIFSTFTVQEQTMLHADILITMSSNLNSGALRKKGSETGFFFIFFLHATFLSKIVSGAQKDRVHFNNILCWNQGYIKKSVLVRLYISI